jgi:hypothetical protein
VYSALPSVATTRGAVPDGTPGPQRTDLIGPNASIDGMDRVLVMRYPDRRAFLELISDLRYLRWIIGGVSLLAFLATGWFLAARRVTRGNGGAKAHE